MYEWCLQYLDDYNPTRKRKNLIVFDDIIVDMTNKTFQAITKELFIRCRKLNTSLPFITQSYFSVPKEVRLNSTHYLIRKIYDKRELQQIPTNHSADIDYKEFMKTCGNCTSEPYSFLTVDTKLPANDSSIFRFIIKMTLTDELIKILNDKIRANEVQYDLDREVAKIYALSSKELNKYENLTGEDLGYKPGVVAQVKFEYFPLGKVFLKNKKIKNIEGISKNQLEKHSKPIKNDIANASTKTSKKLEFFNILRLEAKERLNKIKKLDKEMDHTKLFST